MINLGKRVSVHLYVERASNQTCLRCASLNDKRPQPKEVMKWKTIPLAEWDGAERWVVTPCLLMTVAG